MRILFVMPVATHARFHKRIAGLRAEGADSLILHFDRDYVPGKPLPGESASLGWIDHGNYAKRAWTYLRALGRVRAAARRSDCLYAFGLDLALLGWLATLGPAPAPRMVYEVGDIRESMTGNGFAGRLLRSLERFVCRRSRVVVVTSPSYVDDYYRPRLGLDPASFLLIENKLPADFPCRGAQTEAHEETGRLRIGYFGILRCAHSWRVMKRLLEVAPERFSVVLGGKIWPERIDADEVRSTGGASYGGPYVAPDDLPALYGPVDLVWVAHLHGENNFHWARANRFYEACCFERPMIGQRGTVDGRDIEALGLGCLVDMNDIEESVRRIAAIGDEEIAAWRRNIRSVPVERYRYTDEHARLLERLSAP